MIEDVLIKKLEEDTTTGSGIPDDTKVVPVSQNTISMDRAIHVMSQNLNNQDLPRVGIFWYDIRNQDLFGVVSSQLSEASVSHGLVSINTLHRDWWEKQYNKLKYRNNGGEVYPYTGDYKDTPRGRIFYEIENEMFVIKVGSWINTYPEVKNLIIDEFELKNTNYQFEIDHHWEIGIGWEG